MTTIVYTTEVCPACNMLKQFLDSKQIEYDSLVIGKDITPDEFYEKTKSMSVPVMDIDGLQIIGLDLDKISRALKI